MKTALTLEEMQEEFNKVKNAVISSLAEEGVITREVARDLCLHRMIVLTKPIFITRLYHKLLGTKADIYRIIWAKIENLLDND